MPWAVEGPWHAAGLILDGGGDLTAQEVKAHRTKEQAVAQGDERNYRGNDLADMLAKQAASWGSPNIVEVAPALDLL